MTKFFVNPGQVFTFSKTVSESDVYLFAGITGDFSANHVNEDVMKTTCYGGRIAHGALIVGYMSACSTMASDSSRSTIAETPVSLGYDKIRFLAGVKIGDTVKVNYTIDTIDVERRRSHANVTVHNQNGTLVAVATHILKWVKE